MREKEQTRLLTELIMTRYGKATLTVKEVSEYTGWDVRKVRRKFKDKFDKDGTWTLSVAVLASELS